MSKVVIYDFSVLKHDPADVVDGSDEILPEDERVTEADYRNPAYGLLRQIQDEDRAAARNLSAPKATE